MTKSITTALTRAGAAAIAAFALIGMLSGTAAAENAEIAKLRAAERKTFTDREIISGFLQITFGAELHIAGRADRIRKFDRPVRIYIDNRAKSDRGEQVAAVIADIASRIQNLDIAITDKRKEANLVVTLILDRDLPRTVRALSGPILPQQIQRSLQPRCLSEIRKDKSFRIVRSDAILVTDAGEFVFYDCAYEEILQALGPINDDSAVPWTMFNDDVQKGFFDIYDQYLLNILYDRRIRPGMTQSEVRAVLPQVLADVRAWVAKVNKLPR